MICSTTDTRVMLAADNLREALVQNGRKLSSRHVKRAVDDSIPSLISHSILTL